MLTRRNIGLGILAMAAIVLGVLPLATIAQDKKDDVTGTWKWTQEGFGQQQEYTLKLKQEGEKLTGTLAGGFDQSEVAIEAGKVKDGEVSFKVSRDFGGRPIVTMYTGKVSGTTFKGKSETIFAQEFEAKKG